MFGLGPRTIWKSGVEVELEQEFEAGGSFWSGNNRDENPRDQRMFMHMLTPGLTYGFTRDFALRVKTPYYYMREQSKDGVEWFSGAGKFRVGGAYRFFQNVFPGGSTKASWFADLELPTATRKNGLPAEAEFDDNWTLTWGLGCSTSNTRHYLWADFAGRASTNIDGTGPGPEFQTHLAYAYRFWALTDYKDLDMIMLIEGDFKAATQGMLNGDRDENSGGFVFHLALGFQINITNRVEMKFGVNVPVYRNLYGRQFYHDLVGMLMFSYLI